MKAPGILDYFKDISLSDDQQGALKKIDTFLNASDHNCFLLKGYAGTGKTFLVKGITDYLISQRRQFHLMAPTGRAAMILGAKTEKTAYTIHKTIYDFDKLRDDDHTFRFKYDLKINEDSIDTVYIVDESSMISDFTNEQEFIGFGSGRLLKDIVDHISFLYRPDSKIIFIGDYAQLPPPDQMNLSPALDALYLSNYFKLKVDEYEMKEVQRQLLDSGIISVATALRNSIESNRFEYFDVPDGKDIFPLKEQDFKEAYFEICDHKSLTHQVVVTHSNAQAKDYNTEIRKELFPGMEEIQPGDILMNTKNNYNYSVDIYNGQFIKVAEVSDKPEPVRVITFKKKDGKTAKVSLNFIDIVAEIEDYDGEVHHIKCKIILEFLKSRHRSLTQDQQQALYVDFKQRHAGINPDSVEFKEALRNDKYFNALQVKYGYAITCHKAQGGEWENVFVNFNAYMRTLSRDYFRWAYTAITRSKTTLYAISPKKINPLSEYIVKGNIAKLEKAPANFYRIPEEFSKTETDLEFDKPFHRAKYIEITEKFKGTGININVEHVQFAERYTFQKDEYKVVLDLIYSNKGFGDRMRETRVESPELKKQVLKILDEPFYLPQDYKPPKEHQRMLLDIINEYCEPLDIKILNVHHEKYYDRVFLKTNTTCSFIDCAVDDKGIYKVIKGSSLVGNDDEKLTMLLEKLSND